MRTQINDIHDSLNTTNETLTALSTNINNDLYNVSNTVKILHSAVIKQNSSTNINITSSANKAHVETKEYESGYTGFGFRLFNKRSDLDASQLLLIINNNSNHNISTRIYMNVKNGGWGPANHTGTSDLFNIEAIYYTINKGINKLYLNISEVDFWDNDNVCVVFQITAPYDTNTIGMNLDISFYKNLGLNLSIENIYSSISDITEVITNNTTSINNLYDELYNGFNSFNDMINDKLDNYVTLNAGYKIIKKAEFNKYNNIQYIFDSNPIPVNVNSNIVNKQEFSFNGNKILFTFHSNNIDVPEECNYLWVYGMLSIDITNLIGKDIYFTIKKELVYGEDSIIFNHFQITNSMLSWSRVIKSMNPNIMNSTFNLKDYISETDDENRYYLLIAYDSKVYPENERFIFGSECQYEFSISYIDPSNTKIIATDLMNFNKSEYYTKLETDSLLNAPIKYITCWGDSLTSGGGWTSRLQELTGMTVYNGGTGGENSATICSRQGGDAICINNIIIPADTSDVLIASKNTDHGLLTVENKRVSPLLQGSSANGTHFNPCKIGDIEGTLSWTGSNYADTSGTWVFKRSEAGEAVTIDRPTILRTNYDMNRNNPYLMVIYIGQNGGWDNNLDTLVRQHRLMIEHANAEHVIILGLSSGNTSTRADYETRMKQEFGRYFISLREYLSTPIYENGEIVSCYGIEDQNAEIDMDYISPNANNLTVKQEIEQGIVPHAILADSVHYTTGTKTVIGDLIYKRCKELNIF